MDVGAHTTTAAGTRLPRYTVLQDKQKGVGEGPPHYPDWCVHLKYVVMQ